MPFHLKVFVAAWAVLLCILGIYVVHATKKPQVPAVHKPAFKVGDCFVRNGVREEWEEPAGGKVMFKGMTQYLLMDAAEAERRHGGDKFGYPQSIELFDMNHRKVLCPLAWKPKGITK